jgi:hypothetical protein
MLQYSRPGCKACVPPKGYPIPRCDSCNPDSVLDQLRAQVVAADIIVTASGSLGHKGYTGPCVYRKDGVQQTGARTTDVTRVNQVPLLGSCFSFPGLNLMQGR